MNNFNGANGVNGHIDGYANGNGAATLERSNGAAGEALGGSLLDGALLDLGAEVWAERALPSVQTSRRKRGARFSEAGEPLPPLPRNPYDAAQQRELELAAKVCTAALKSEYATALLDWNITGDDVRALAEDVRLARVTANDAVASTNLRRGATASEKVAKGRLTASFRTVQSAARKAFAETRPDHVYDYGVANALASRTAITQVYEAILKQLETDLLPGITPQKLALLTARYEAWTATQTEQSDAQSGATTFRTQRNSETKTVGTRRREIQVAANGEWPPLPENHGIRREFGLNPKRNFSPREKRKK